MKRPISLAILAGVICFISAVYITFPLIFHLKDYATGYGDELLIAWIQNWDIHALLTSPQHLFEANIFYPYHNSLAFSETFLTSSILSFIPLVILHEPIVATNFTLISSLMMLGISVYLLSYYLTREFLPSMLSGLLIMFSPVVLDKAVHLQVLSLQWVPLSLLCYIHFLKTKEIRYCFLSALFFLVQVYNSFLPGYFLIFLYIGTFLFLYQKKQAIFSTVLNTKTICTGVVAALFVFPIILPYFQVSKEFAFTRDIREAIHLAIQPEDLIDASSYSRFYHVLNLFPFNNPANYPSFTEMKPGFLGILFTVLSILMIIDVIKNRKKSNPVFTALIVVGVIGLVLSFGPALHFNRQTIHHPFLIPLPYALFYYLAPGFKGFRNSFRWEMLLVITFAPATGIYLQKIVKRFQTNTRVFVYLLCILGVITEFNFPMHFINVPQTKDFSPAYTWMNTTPKDTTMIEMPVYNWNMFPYASEELMRDYYTTVHFRKTVNGASGFSPPPWQTMVTDIAQSFPGEKTIQHLHDIGVKYVLVHKTEFDRIHEAHFMVNDTVLPNGKSVIDMLKVNKHLVLVKRFGDDYIFLIR